MHDLVHHLFFIWNHVCPFFLIFIVESQMHFQGYLKYVVIFIALCALLFVTVLYLRHQLETKYRDLSIIFLLLIIFLFGVQYSQYEQNQVLCERYVTHGNIFNFRERITTGDGRRYSGQ